MSIAVMEKGKLKNILIVDDEQSFLLSLVQGLVAYASDFSTVTAPNGKVAIEVLKANGIDLVVTDLKMPELDGFGLLAHMSKNYPQIPVIVMSAYCTPEIKARVNSLGAFKILEKPIDFQDFVEHIFAELHAVSKGYINGITLPAFLQLVEMEKKTCTLRIGSHGKTGFLYFLEGSLIDADNGVDKHEKAALDIVCWEDPSIEIDSFCKIKERSIKSSLSYLLLEGFRLRDEKQKYAGNGSAASAGSAESGTGANTLSAVAGDAQGQNSREANKSGARTTTKEANMATTREILSELAKLESIEAVCLVARDGFLLDSIARKGIDREMIGAIASSGFGASDSMGRQLEKGAVQISMIEFEKGPVMLAPIGADAFLVIVADKDANLGMIRLKLKKHSHDLALAAAI
jgi:predicted regulator of Ras-like GTPase activity (Roadblock/LC7/MglB family)/ActR/RegA family two-component response regulator